MRKPSPPWGLGNRSEELGLRDLRVPLLLPGGAAVRCPCRRCARRQKAVPSRQDAHAEKRRSLWGKMAPSAVLRPFSRLLAPARLPSCCECLLRPPRPSAYSPPARTLLGPP
ncbi:hypothetical protein A6R68_19050 [Neotoma lepida]|uniref:Uncharacterized protein n=1 Tax=Neotoma lepida TaxID=56216 RepID=A0A1A6HLJ5_NEOLE|nr:hypothetical protein A6R68_19050 [Neotoma lepida]